MFCWLSGSVLFSWVCVLVLSHVHLFATPWTVACQSPLSMKLPSQEYCSGLPFLSGLHCGSHGKEFCLQCRRPRYDPWVGKIPWRREWQPIPVFLPGKSRGPRNQAGYIQFMGLQSRARLNDSLSRWFWCPFKFESLCFVKKIILI